jgi:hypothetical protein
VLHDARASGDFPCVVPGRDIDAKAMRVDHRQQLLGTTGAMSSTNERERESVCVCVWGGGVERESACVCMRAREYGLMAAHVLHYSSCLAHIRRDGPLQQRRYVPFTTYGAQNGAHSACSVYAHSENDVNTSAELSHLGVFLVSARCHTVCASPGAHPQYSVASARASSWSAVFASPHDQPSPPGESVTSPASLKLSSGPSFCPAVAAGLNRRFE